MLLLFAPFLCLGLQQTSKPVTVAYDSIKGVDPNLLSLDLYPLKGDKPHPVMVMIHGGGWRTGDKANRSMFQFKAPHFRAAGYVYVSINYRLSSKPGVKHPVHVRDVAKALSWVHDNVADHGGDPGRIFVMGHSAGAHLAALVSTDARHLKEAGKDLSILKGTVCLDTAGYDILRYFKELGILPQGRKIYENAFGTNEEGWRDASPRHHTAPDKNIPPHLLFHTRGRLQVEQLSKEFVEALRKAGIPAKAVYAPDKDHGGINACIGQPGDRYTKLVMEFLKDPSKAGDLKIDTPAEEPNPFGVLDRDGDRKLTREEYSRWRRAPVTFDEVDTDKDGILTVEEALANPRIRAIHRSRSSGKP